MSALHFFSIPLRRQLASLAVVGTLIPAPAVAQEPPGTWEQVPELPTDGRYDDLWFIDAQNGWTVNYDGQLYGTDDGGTTWALRFDVGTDVNFRSVTFLDDMHGFVGTIGDSTEALWETTDGGYTLTNITARIAGPDPLGICGMWPIDSLTVVAVGPYYREPRFLRTTDGGQTWTSRDLSHLVDGLVDVRFFDANRGIAVGATGSCLTGDRHVAVIRTEDAGETWSIRHTSSGPCEGGWKITFPTPDVGYVAVQNGNDFAAHAKVLKTTDGGLTWTDLPLPPSDFQSGVAFISDSVGWVGGRFAGHTRSLALTTDGGATWTVQAAPIDPSVINRIRFFDFGEGPFGFAGGGAFYRHRPGVNPATEGPSRQPATRLGEPVPNPFEDETHLAYTIERAANVLVEVFDASGRRVAVLVDARQPAGSHEARWDGADATGRRMAAGSYVVRLVAAGETRAQRAVMSR